MCVDGCDNVHVCMRACAVCMSVFACIRYQVRSLIFFFDPLSSDDFETHVREHERLRTQLLAHSVSDDELSSGSGGAPTGVVPSIAVGASAPAHAPARLSSPTGAASISPTNSGTLGGGPLLKSSALV